MRRISSCLMPLAVLGVVALNSGQAQEGHHGSVAYDGMEHHDHAQGMPGSGTGAVHRELPKVKSEIRRINTRATTISLRHGEIPNLDMPPMTMVFQVADPVLLEGLAVGDEILATFDQIDGAYTVLSVEPMK